MPATGSDERDGVSKYPVNNPIEDTALDEAVSALTREKIKAAIDQVLDREASARLRIYHDTCVRCGLCASACHSYLSRDRDPRFAPVSKVKDTLWRLIDERENVPPADLREMAQIAFLECGTCRRCSQYCPFGIDIAHLMLTVRRVCHLLGLVPKYLQDTTDSHSATGNQMWIHQDEWIDTALWQEEDACDELAGARVPMEREGADIMYSVIAPEPKILAQLMGNMAVVMKAADLDWTYPDTDGWDNSNMAMYSGDFEVMGRIARKHWDTAMRLGVNRVVMGECGHAFRGAMYDGPRWLGFKQPPLPLVHAIEFYWDLLESGKVTIAKKFDTPVTVQDPCNTVRGQGLGGKLREVINAMCSDFRDMNPRLEHNYCCNAGGGQINCGPPGKITRMTSARVKAEQLAATGAEICITPCHNCHSGIEDVVGHYDLKMKTKFLIEIMAECIQLPGAGDQGAED